MKQAGQVRRPFQAQAFTLILLCRTLVAEFEKEPPRRTADNALALEECVLPIETHQLTHFLLIVHHQRVR